MGGLKLNAKKTESSIHAWKSTRKERKHLISVHYERANKQKLMNLILIGMRYEEAMNDSR